jgi:hypothetical protein
VTEILISCLGDASLRDDGDIMLRLRSDVGGQMVLTICAGEPGPVEAMRKAAFMVGLETMFVRDLLAQFDVGLRFRGDDGLQAELTILP